MIPDFQTLMLPLLQQLADKKEHHIKKIVDALAVKFDLTEEEKNELIPSQRQPTIYNRVLWANTYLKKSGLISSPKRGVVMISKRGEHVLSQNIDKINISFLKQFPEFIEFQNKSRQDDNNQSVDSHVDEDRQQDPLTTLLDAQTTIVDDFLSAKVSTMQLLVTHSGQLFIKPGDQLLTFSAADLLFNRFFQHLKQQVFRLTDLP